jgi:hypothetical protein
MPSRPLQCITAYPLARGKRSDPRTIRDGHLKAGDKSVIHALLETAPLCFDPVKAIKLPRPDERIQGILMVKTAISFATSPLSPPRRVCIANRLVPFREERLAQHLNMRLNQILETRDRAPEHI